MTDAGVIETDSVHFVGKSPIARELAGAILEAKRALEHQEGHRLTVGFARPLDRSSDTPIEIRESGRPSRFYTRREARDLVRRLNGFLEGTR